MPAIDSTAVRGCMPIMARGAAGCHHDSAPEVGTAIAESQAAGAGKFDASSTEDGFDFQ